MVSRRRDSAKQPANGSQHEQARQPGKKQTAARAKSVGVDEALPRDPQAEREATRYQRPIASREHILDVLSAPNRAMTYDQLRTHLQLTDATDSEALSRRLRAMCRDSQLVLSAEGTYTPLDRRSLRAARVQLRRDGSGVLKFDDRGTDVAVRAEEVRGLVDGDHVEVRVELDRDGQADAYIATVLERASEPVVGVIWDDGDCFLVRAERGLVNEEIIVPRDAVGTARTGDYVLIRLTHAAEPRQRPRGEVVRVLGAPEEAGVEREVILSAHRIPREFNAATLAEAAAMPVEPDTDDFSGRVDLRDLPLVTIDGEDARDFDDAVYAERRSGGGFRLLVAIADVGHYVQIGTALDTEAQRRGNSVYFPDMVIPMLPEAISNGLCSLRPDVNRLCMVCDMTISRAGRISGYTFYEGVMKSAARLTYNQVADVLGLHEDAPTEPLVSSLAPEVRTRLSVLLDVYRILRTEREHRGALDFRSTETRIVFNERGRIDRIEPRKRNRAHQLIEECMVAANVCAARLLSESALVGVYRVHEPPSFDRWADLRAFLATLGVRLPGSEQDVPRPADLQRVLAETGTRPYAHVIETVVLRSLMQAHYSPHDLGHFGLALGHYTHFTSPIRRYADLLVHRALRYLIRKGAHPGVERVRGAPRLAKERIYPYDEDALTRITEAISFTERRADLAVRDLEDWLKCDFMSDHLGEAFTATVAAVTSFGIFVELQDLYIQGLVHISALGQDYYEFDAVRMQLRGERTGERYRIGTSLQVQCARVDLGLRRIDFVPVGVTQRAESSPVQRAKRPASGKPRDAKGSGSRTGAGRGARRRRTG